MTSFKESDCSSSFTWAALPKTYKPNQPPALNPLYLVALWLEDPGKEVRI